MKKYYPVDFDEKGNAVLGTPKNTPTSNGFIPTTWAPGGGSEDEGNGIKSITISPAITTTPALDSMFPIYWDDLPEGEIEEGVEYREYTATLHTGHALTNGDQYSISITPTSEWHYEMIDVSGGDGETVTTTRTVAQNTLPINGEIHNHDNTEFIVLNILIME